MPAEAGVTVPLALGRSRNASGFGTLGVVIPRVGEAVLAEWQGLKGEEGRGEG